MNSVVIRILLTAMGAVGLGGCFDGPHLFEPAPPPAVRVVLPSGSISLYETDTLLVTAEGQGALRVEGIFLDSTGVVLWRSEPSMVTGGEARVEVTDIPMAIERGSRVRLTAVATDASGHRWYAADDSAATERLVDAATRPAWIYAGRRLRVGNDVAVRPLTLDGESGIAYFPSPESATVGVLDLVRGLGEDIPVGVRPGHVAVRGGRLLAVAENGSEVAFIDLRGSSGGIVDLEPLELELDSILVAALPPIGLSADILCVTPECRAPLAIIPSPVLVLSGSAGGDGSPAVLRLVAPPGATAANPPMVIPGFSSALRTDTSVTATVRGTGTGTPVYRRERASACTATTTGVPVLATAATGAVYVAATGLSAPCGHGSRILRLDGVGSEAVTISAIGVMNTKGETRLDRIADLQVSGTGDLLVRTQEGVVLLSPDLRVRSSIPVVGIRSATWLQGNVAEASRFAISDAEGVSIYDAVRLVEIERIPLGPTMGPIVFFGRPDGGSFVAASVQGGFVVATTSPE